MSRRRWPRLRGWLSVSAGAAATRSTLGPRRATTSPRVWPFKTGVPGLTAGSAPDGVVRFIASAGPMETLGTGSQSRSARIAASVSSNPQPVWRRLRRRWTHHHEVTATGNRTQARTGRGSHLSVPLNPPRHVRRLQSLGGMESCQERRRRGTPPELRERAVRMVTEIAGQHDSEWADMTEVAQAA